MLLHKWRYFFIQILLLKLPVCKKLNCWRCKWNYNWNYFFWILKKVLAHCETAEDELWKWKYFFEQIRIQEELPKNQKHFSVIIWFCHHIMVQCNITSFEIYSTTRIENSFCQLVQIIRIISASYCFWVWMCMPPRLLWLFKMTPWCQVRKPSNNFWFKSPVSS